MQQSPREAVTACSSGDEACQQQLGLLRGLQDEIDALRLYVRDLETRLADAAPLVSAPSSIFQNSLLLCQSAVFKASQRLDSRYLRQIFDTYVDGSGSLPAAALTRALTDVDAPLIPDSAAAVAVAINRFNACSSGVINFDTFVRAAREPDELALYFQEKQLPLLADALRALVGRSENQLMKLIELSDDEMQAASASVCGRLPEQAKMIQEELRLSFAVQFDMQAKMQTDGNKFNVVEMACGSIEDFHSGLAGRLGMPHLGFKREMMREHCERAGCNTQFTTGNYSITTTPKLEWMYTAGDEQGQRTLCPAENMCHDRQIIAIDQLMLLPLVARAQLSEVEVISLVLYTGPMFQIYNTVLRRFPEDKYKLFDEGNNKFATTIFVLVSAVSKIAKCTRVPQGTLLYRGLGGFINFPPQFFSADDNGASGYADWGFMSTSSDRNIALGYSGVMQRRPKAIVMVIEPNSIDRGADISMFSQYPGEKEFLWVPCSFVQRAQPAIDRVEVVDGGLVTFVSVRVNLNLKTETVQELKKKKKRLHMTSAFAMVEEVRYELEEWAKSAKAAERLQQDWSRNHHGSFSTASLAAAIVEQCMTVVRRHKATDIEEYVDDSGFRALVSEILDAKAWSKEKMQLWMQDESQFIYTLQGFSLRECHRLWLCFLRMRMNTFDGTSTIDRELRALVGEELLVSRKLIKGKVQGETNADGETVMVQAGGDGWVAEDINAAIAAGADMKATDGAGINCVWNAARYGQVDSLALLLASGGDVNQCRSDGASSVYIAAYQGFAHLIPLLVSAGGDVNKCDHDGQSPIWISSWYGGTHVIEQLLCARGDVNKCNNDGFSPIWVAAFHGHFACLSLLISAKGDVNKCTNDGTCADYNFWDTSFVGVSPLFAAAFNGHAACIDILLSSGGNVNSCRDDGASLMYVAAQNGHAECIPLLVSSGADVNKCDNHGRSCLWIAAQNGKTDCIVQLLSHGANPSIIFEGTSALDQARLKCHMECVRLLEAASARVAECRKH